MLEPNLASRLLIPFSARYLVLDNYVKDYTNSPLLTQDASLKPVFKSGGLQTYEVTGDQPAVWAAGKTVKGWSYWDYLAMIQKIPADELRKVSFILGTGTIPKANGLLNIDDYLEGNLIANAGFEEGTILGEPQFWQVTSADLVPVDVLLDISRKVGGNESLKVVNKATAPWSLGWIKGAEISAIPGSIYEFSCNVKYANANWTSVIVEGYQKSTCQWIQLVHCPSIKAGTANWSKHSCSFHLPQGITKIRPALAAGWSRDQKNPATSWYDDIRLERVSDSLYSNLLSVGQPPSVTYKQLGPQKYVVHIKNAEAPYALVFGESFDSPWIAKLPDGTAIDPVPYYSTINGFPISKTGTYDVVIEYEPQGWFALGFVVSMLALFLCLAYLVYAFARKPAEGVGMQKVAVIGGAKKAASSIREYLEMPPRYNHQGLPITSLWKRIKAIIASNTALAVRTTMDYFEMPPKYDHHGRPLPAWWKRAGAFCSRVSDRATNAIRKLLDIGHTD